MLSRKSFTCKSLSLIFCLCAVWFYLSARYIPKSRVYSEHGWYHFPPAREQKPGMSEERTDISGKHTLAISDQFSQELIRKSALDQEIELYPDSVMSHRETEGEMIARHRSVENHCRSVRRTSMWQVSNHLLHSKHYNFSYCFVPKVGCTFWKTVVFLLEKPGISAEEFTQKVLHPDESIHYLPMPYIQRLDWNDMFELVRSGKSVVFTRDPYSRLFSAYINKLVLPMTWNDVGRNIIQLFRTDSSAGSLECGHDVTFEEFLRYVIYVEKTGNITYVGIDDHWAPVTSLCQMCKMNYDFIGKQETFAKDRDYIFRELGISKLMLKNVTVSDTIRGIMNSTMSSFEYLFHHHHCITKQDIINRIWYSFQTQGYLSLHSNNPFGQLDLNSTKYSEVQQMFLSSYEQNKPTPHQVKQQRHEALVDAYENIPLSTKRGIQEAFRNDFELFGYDIEPQEIFSGY